MKVVCQARHNFDSVWKIAVEESVNGIRRVELIYLIFVHEEGACKGSGPIGQRDEHEAMPWPDVQPFWREGLSPGTWIYVGHGELLVGGGDIALREITSVTTSHCSSDPGESAVRSHNELCGNLEGVICILGLQRHGRGIQVDRDAAGAEGEADTTGGIASIKKDVVETIAGDRKKELSWLTVSLKL